MTLASSELSPIALVQNPAFGGVVLWRFGRAFQSEKIDELPPLNSFFLVLPIVLHAMTLEIVLSTYQSSGLTKFIEKIAESREQLYAIHERALALRGLTLDSLASAVSAQLISLNYETALVRSNELTPPTSPEAIKGHMAGADKLGRWFARLPLVQVHSLLQVGP